MTDELLKKLDELIAVTKQPAIPLSVDLWDYATIASYLKLSATHVSQLLAQKAALNLAKAKGRHNIEMAMNKLLDTLK